MIKTFGNVNKEHLLDISTFFTQVSHLKSLMNSSLIYSLRDS